MSSPQGATNSQLTCETCKLWVQQTYSQEDFHKVVTHPCVGFSNEGPTHWPLLHSTHVMRSTGKAWGCLGCKQVVGVTSKNLKRALQLPCRSTGRQANLQFAGLGRPSLNTRTCPQVRPSAEPPDPPGEAAGPPAGHRGDGQSLSLSLGSPSAPAAVSRAPTKPRPRPKAKPKVDPAQRTLRF